MKGRKLIVITCVIALSFAGVGYSAWTQGLTINSIFSTGKIHVVFQDFESDELCEISVDENKNVLNIYGSVAPGSKVVVKYDIYNDIDNDSSIPVKYYPDDTVLPEGIILDQNEAVFEPGEYLEDNQLTILEPGENELILPFVQYNSNGSSGWKEELKIKWKITVAEEIVDTELDILNENGLIDEEAIHDIPVSEDLTEDASGAEPPLTETTPGVDPPPDSEPKGPDESNLAPETPVIDVPSEDPKNNGNLYEETIQSETRTETNVDSIVEDNAETDKGTEKNVKDGEE